MGLKECCRCRTMRLIDLDFYSDAKHGVCKHCQGYKGTGGGRYPKMLPETRQRIVELHNEGQPGIQIAQSVSCTPAMVSKVLRESLKEFTCSRCKNTTKALQHQLCSECASFVRNHPTAAKRDLALRFNYGLSLAQYETLLEKQEGLCAICRLPNTSKRRKYLAVDHDHETQEVRGLLCDQCNVGLGSFKDDPELLRRASLYLTGPR